jgi:hypothetical protein
MASHPDAKLHVIFFLSLTRLHPAVPATSGPTLTIKFISAQRFAFGACGSGPSPRGASGPCGLFFMAIGVGRPGKQCVMNHRGHNCELIRTSLISLLRKRWPVMSEAAKLSTSERLVCLFSLRVTVSLRPPAFMAISACLPHSTALHKMESRLSDSPSSSRDHFRISLSCQTRRTSQHLPHIRQHQSTPPTHPTTPPTRPTTLPTHPTTLPTPPNTLNSASSASPPTTKQSLLRTTYLGIQRTR